jgi:hypothetical protein
MFFFHGQTSLPELFIKNAGAFFTPALEDFITGEAKKGD